MGGDEITPKSSVIALFCPKNAILPIAQKNNELTTIKDNDELVDMVMYHNFVKSSPKRCDFLNNCILELVKKVFDREEVGKDVLLPAMQCILDQDVEILKTQPYLVMLCYLAIHYLEEEELLYLFKKSVKEGQISIVMTIVLKMTEHLLNHLEK